MPVKCGIADTLKLNIKKTSEMSESDIEMHKASRDAVIGDMADIMGKIDRGEPVQPGELQHSAMLAAAVADKVRSIEGRFGPKARPGAVHGGDSAIKMQDVTDFGERLAAAVPEGKLYAILDSLEPYQQEQFLANMWRGRKTTGNGLTNLYMPLYLAAKLSNPYTLGKAVVGHFAAMPMALSDRFFAETWGRTGLFGDDRYVPGEAAVGAMSFWTNLQDQLKMIGRGDWSGIHTQMVTEGEYHPPINMPDNMAGNLVNAVAGAPGYGLGAQRASFGVISRLGSLDMAAFREATREASEKGLDRDGLLKAQEFYRRNPTQSMLEEAQDFKETYTYTKNVSGLLGNAQKAVQGDIGKVLVDPFPKVSLNMLDTVIDHFPGVALLKEQNRADIAAGGRRAQAALGKQSTGFLVMGTGLALGLGGLITGEGPTDPRARKIWEEAGYRKNYVNDPFTGTPLFSHEALGPFSGVLGAMGDIAFMLRHLDQHGRESVVSTVALALSEPFSRAGYIEAWGQITGAIRDGMDKESFFRLMRNKFEGLGIVLTPGIANFARDVSDPDRKAAPRPVGRGGFLEREWKLMKDDITASWPGWAEGMPQMRNFITDEAVPRDGAAPWNKTVTGDPVAKELFRLGTNNGGQKFAVLAPPNTIGGTAVRGGLQSAPESAWAGVPLEAWEKDRLIQLMATTPNGPDNLKLADALKDLMASDDYLAQKDGPEGGKAQRIQKLYRGYELAAERMLLDEDPHLAWMVAEKKTQQADTSSPQGAPAEQNPLGAEPKPTVYPRPGQKERE